MINIDYRNPKPVYEQLVESLKNLILCGALAPDEQLPSVRQLAKELTINPNTVQKAYTELERIGMTYTSPGRGSFVSPDADSIRQMQKKEMSDNITKLFSESREIGMTKEEILTLADNIWKN